MSIPWAKRGPCKWHGYVCHREPLPGTSLCAFHAPAVRVLGIANKAVLGASKGPAEYARYEAAERRASASYIDPGCDCEACLRTVVGA